MIYQSGALRGEKVQYLDGTVSYAIWYPYGEDEECSETFDFFEEDLKDLYILLDILSDAVSCFMPERDLEYYDEN